MNPLMGAVSLVILQCTSDITKLLFTMHFLGPIFLLLSYTLFCASGCPSSQHRGMVDNSTSINRQAVSDKIYLWPNGIVPYKISSKYGASSKKIILDGIAEFDKYTCIKFIPRTNEKDYILFEEHSSNMCWTGKWGDSRVGHLGGLQYVSLIVNQGCMRKFNVMHELMHTLGFWHEQQRDDRDKYIKVLFNNIDPVFHDVSFGIKQQARDHVTNLNTPYDYNSIMHYHQWAFALNPSKPVMVATDGCSVFGNENQLSKVDVLRMNLLYKCSTPYKPSPPRVTSPMCPSCKDKNADCAQQASAGKCATNSVYMYNNCRKSCGIC